MKLKYGDQPLNGMKTVAPLPIKWAKKREKKKERKILVVGQRWSHSRVRVVKIQ
jgi:hypothetical protein